MGRAWWRNDIVLLVLGVFSIGLVFWFDTGNLGATQKTVIIWVDAVLVVYFIADWVAMWKENRWNIKWFGWNAWRLLGMIPLFVASFSFLRLLRLARVVNVLDYIPPVRKGIAQLRRSFSSGTLRPLAIAAGGITLVGSLLVWLAERRFNPNLAEYSEAIWWAIVTVTTVGYGDITVITPIGRTVAVVLMVTGIGTIGLLASQVSTALITAPGGEEKSMVLELQSLADLHKEGHLDDDEFAAAKARVLGEAKKSG